jgi:ribose transport system permease protein
VQRVAILEDGERVVLAVGLYDRSFFSATNMLEVTADTMTLFLMASGVTLVIMMGGIDLSVGAVLALATVVAALIAVRCIR